LEKKTDHNTPIEPPPLTARPVRSAALTSPPQRDDDTKNASGVYISIYGYYATQHDDDVLGSVSAEVTSAILSGALASSIATFAAEARQNIK